jgi:hypothetical protein
MMRCTANIFSSSDRNHAVPGPAGSQNHATRAMKMVRLPSMMKRYCQLWRWVLLRWKMANADVMSQYSTKQTVV